MYIERKNMKISKKNKHFPMPKDLWREAQWQLLIEIVVTILSDVATFTIQLSKSQMQLGRVTVALTILLLYYVSDVFFTALSNVQNEKDLIIEERGKIEAAEIVTKLAMKVQGKVWDGNERMSHRVVIQSLKEYVFGEWRMRIDAPKKIFDIVSAIYICIGFWIASREEIQGFKLFPAVVLIALICKCLFSAYRLKKRKEVRKKLKDISFEEREIANDINNIQPVNDIHINWMVARYVDFLSKSFLIKKQLKRKINSMELLNSLLGVMIIVFILFFSIKDVEKSNIDATLILSIMSMVTIYNKVISKFNRILRGVEDWKNQLEEQRKYNDEVTKIMEVASSLENEQAKPKRDIVIRPFKVEYPRKDETRPFTLSLDTCLDIPNSSVVMLEGATGSGKTTFMKFVTGMLRIDGCENPVIPKAVELGQGSKLGSGNILSEVTWDKVDEGKLIQILKGLHLYEEIQENAEDVISYLGETTYDNYSSGQQQRLLITRLLYNLEENIGVVGIDEMTNNLNDEIAVQTMQYILQYCEGRTVIISTHQVDIMKKFADIEIKFANGKCHIIN